MKYWLWWALFLSSCQSPPPPPPISQDTTIRILRDLYAVKAHHKYQGTLPQTAESLLSLYTAQLLRVYHIDTARWNALRHYYARYPKLWHELLDKALTTSQ
ncbi:MAG: hypothetical protein RMJ57_02570 [Bacteroidia bacterium]|nr:hypothetical protein [Bacteroidia bacterium]